MNGQNDISAQDQAQDQAEARDSSKLAVKRDTSISCRERASDDLVKAGAEMTVNERLILERSAANWNARANLLDQVEKTARERDPGAQA
jgi:hypothetical protein